jgi:hypothetical protein
MGLININFILYLPTLVASSTCTAKREILS